LEQVFDAVAAECEKQGLMIHLDNHISKAKWCCDTGDGNSWFGDREFDAQNWERAWRFMANHVSLFSLMAIPLMSIFLHNLYQRVFEKFVRNTIDK